MTDVTTQQRLRVSADGTAGPYLMLPVSRLDEVEALLKRNGISYWVEENAISLNGEPEVGVVNFGRGADADAVQEVLDGVR